MHRVCRDNDACLLQSSENQWPISPQRLPSTKTQRVWFQTRLLCSVRRLLFFVFIRKPAVISINGNDVANVTHSIMDIACLFSGFFHFYKLGCSRVDHGRSSIASNSLRRSLLRRPKSNWTFKRELHARHVIVLISWGDTSQQKMLAYDMI